MKVTEFIVLKKKIMLYYSLIYIGIVKYKLLWQNSNIKLILANCNGVCHIMVFLKVVNFEYNMIVRNLFEMS